MRDKLDLRRPQHRHLAAHAAQARQIAARTHPTAVDNYASARTRLPDRVGNCLAEAELGTLPARGHYEIGQGLARNNVSFRLEEQAARKASRKIRLEPADLIRIDAPVPFGQALEPYKLALVSRRRDHQAATRHHSRKCFPPEGKAADAELLDDRLGSLRLAVRCQHRTRKSTCAAHRRFRHRLEQRNPMAPARQVERLPQAKDAASYHADR